MTENLRQPLFEAGAEAEIALENKSFAQGLAAAPPEEIDAAFDAVGGPQVADIAAATPPRGTIVIHGALSNEPTPFPLLVALRKNLSLRGYYYTEVTDDPAVLSRGQSVLAGGIAAGIIALRIDHSFTLDEIADAHAYLESG